MYFEGFGASNYASRLVLIVGELLSIKVGQVRFSPRRDNGHELMSIGCYLDIRTLDVVCIVFGGWECDQVCVSFAALTLPHHGWLKEPFHKGVRWHRVVLSAHTSEDVGRLINFSSDMMELESFKLS